MSKLSINIFDIVISIIVGGSIGLGLGLFFPRLNHNNDKKGILLGLIRGEIGDLNISISKRFSELSNNDKKRINHFPTYNE